MALRKFQVQPTFTVHVHEDDVERLCAIHEVDTFEEVLRHIVADGIEEMVRNEVDFNEANMGWSGLYEILIDEEESDE